MSLAPSQRRFAQVFARETGLNPHVVGAWLLAEQSGSAAQFYEKKGYNNWLNIARTDSGDKAGAHGNVWANPDSAAKASAQWMKGEGPIASSYGKPAGGIMAILKTAGQAPHRQIQAIAGSGWASSGYNGGTTLSQLLGETGDVRSGENLPRVVGRAASKGGLEERTTNRSGLDSGAYNEAVGRANAIRGVAGLFGGNKPGDALLREALEKAGAPPRPQEYQSSQVEHQIVKTPTGTFSMPSSGGGYVHPIPGAHVGRTDMGVDLSAAPGTPIRAIGDSKVLGIHPNWFQGQPYVDLELLNGPHAGKVYYVAEQIAPSVKPGQTVKGGHAIGHVAGSGTGLELGWGRRGGQTEAQATTGYHEGQVTPSGQHFAQFLKGLR